MVRVRENRLLALLLVVALVIAQSSMFVMAADNDEITPFAAGTNKGAILYNINENGVLEFNVVHTADINGAQIVDNTGSGIVTIDSLKEIMGTPDAPARVHGTDVGERTLGKAVTADLEIDENDKVINVTITGIRERPVVGISWKATSVGTDYAGFAEAFERNGALAVFLPRVTNAEEAQAVLSKLNGLFETGGEDWNPYLYNPEGMTPYGSSGWNNARDTSDLHMMQQAVAMDVPLLMVCRGHQGFNVAMGGGLIQDIPYYLGQEVAAGRIDESRVTSNTAAGNWNKRVLSDPNDIYSSVVTEVVPDWGARKMQVDGLIHSGGTAYHKLGDTENVGIDTNSKWLYDIIGSTTMEFVATAHHQAVDPENLGNGLTIVAHSSDGIVEAIEHQDSLFALGVQWHPERDALRDTRGVGLNLDECNALLRALVRYAGVYVDRQAEANLQLTTDAHLVKKGDYFRLTPFFKEAVNSNAAILDFTFDTTKFEYRGYTPAGGVTVLNTDKTDTGVKITVMIDDYKAKNFGEVLMSAKTDVDLQNEDNEIVLKLDYVVKDAKTGEKKIYSATAGTVFTSTGEDPDPKPGDVTLIDLSNIIDLFGITKTHELWNSKYKYFDHNNNGEIDIYDISYVAKLIK